MTTNKYLLKALDAYPYNLEEAVESLDYALSYNREDTSALSLMGRLHAEIFKDYETAKVYFLEALAIDVQAKNIYPYYINTLINNADYDVAEKFINFALQQKGSEKGTLLLNKALMYECQMKFKKALKQLKEAKLQSYNQDFLNTIKTYEERILQKININKEKKDKKNKSDKNGKKAA